MQGRLLVDDTTPAGTFDIFSSFSQMSSCTPPQVYLILCWERVSMVTGFNFHARLHLAIPHFVLSQFKSVLLSQMGPYFSQVDFVAS